VPATSPGDLVVIRDDVIGFGNGAKREVEIEVVGLTGASGTITFSPTLTEIPAWTNAVSCDATSCVLGGAVDPAIVTVSFRTGPAPLTIELRNSTGAVVETYTSP
jgi:hypothetical protein